MKKSEMLLELIDSFENMYLGMLDQLTDGRPSFAIRYTCCKTAIDIMKKEPSGSPAIDKLFHKFLEDEMKRLEPRIYRTTIKVN